MCIEKEWVISKIEGFVSNKIDITEIDISGFIDEIIKEVNEKNNFYLNAEVLAFSFSISNGKNKNNSWGTYYGPMLQQIDNNGLLKEYPNLNSVTSKHLQYWDERTSGTSSNLLKLHYADLIWDFSIVIDKTYKKIEFANIVIDNTIS
jgi:hypothetical protein